MSCIPFSLIPNMAARIVELEEETAKPVDNKPVIFIATPAYGCMTTVQYLQCILHTQLTLSAEGYGIMLDTVGNESLITRARNIMTKRFMQSSATHLLFIDADISWDPQAILRLVAKNEGVVTTSYPKKHIDWAKVDKRLKDGGDEPIQQVGLDFNLNVTESEVQVVNGFAKVLDAATGFMLVKREVIEAMYQHYETELLVKNDLLGAQQTIKDYVAVFDCMIDPVTRRPLSEDFAFSRRWQKMGGHVYMDLFTPLGHTGGFHYEGDIKTRLAGSGNLQLSKTSPPENDEIKAVPNRKTVLLAILPADEKVSVGFVMTMAKLLATLQGDPRYSAQVRIFENKNKACDHFWTYSAYDSLLLLDGTLSFEPQLILDLLQSLSPFEIGVYPEARAINWNTLRQGNSETIKTQGLEYNIQLLPGSKGEALVAPLGLCKIDRCVLDRINSRLDPNATYCSGTRKLWFHDGIFEDRNIDGDEMFCRLWGAGISLNKAEVTKLGSMTFAGVVMARKQIR